MVKALKKHLFWFYWILPFFKLIWEEEINNLTKFQEVNSSLDEAKNADIP
jgi:hypothetical protein